MKLKMWQYWNYPKRKKEGAVERKREEREGRAGKWKGERRRGGEGRERGKGRWGGEGR